MAVRTPWIADAIARLVRDDELQAAAARVEGALAASPFQSGPWVTVATSSTGTVLAAAAESGGRLLVASAAPARDLFTPLLLRSLANALGTVLDCSAPRSCRSPTVGSASGRDRLRRRRFRTPLRCGATTATTTAAGSGWPRWHFSRSSRGCAVRARRRANGARTSNVLPDGPAGIGGIVAAAARRGRVMALVEAAAWGGAVAALWPVLGVFAAAAVAAWRWRTTRREAIVRALERAQPAARNLFITADELERDALAAKPAIRARVLADAAAVRAAGSRRAISSRPRRSHAPSQPSSSRGQWRPPFRGGGRPAIPARHRRPHKRPLERAAGRRRCA